MSAWGLFRCLGAFAESSLCCRLSPCRKSQPRVATMLTGFSTPTHRTCCKESCEYTSMCPSRVTLYCCVVKLRLSGISASLEKVFVSQGTKDLVFVVQYWPRACECFIFIFNSELQLWLLLFWCFPTAPAVLSRNVDPLSQQRSSRTQIFFRGFALTSKILMISFF